MEIGFYAGSFDPFTNGHLHVVQKSTKYDVLPLPFPGSHQHPLQHNLQFNIDP